MYIISTENAPKAIGPYSQGICTGVLVFTSGQLPIDPADGKLIAEDIKKATSQSLENIKAILAGAGLGLENVIKTTVLLKDINDFAEMNEVYGNYFTSNYPARSCFQVAALPLGASIEIEVVALRPE
jgi:2-iminobutanoate/2-iminopropanoate deaminase